MTVSYSGNLARTLLRWKGSIWQAVWKELFIFMGLYFSVRLIYTEVIVVHFPDSVDDVNSIIKMFEYYTQYIPLTFLLGFYVANVVSRWWQQFTAVAWPDAVLSLICFAISGKDEDSKLYRHRIGRYLCLTCALGWRDVSLQVRQRFPTVRHLVQTGLMTEEEFKLYNAIPAENIRWCLPIQWIQGIIEELFSAGRISPLFPAGVLLKELNEFRRQFLNLYCYDWVTIPLAYTQVTAIALYGYFSFCIIGRQFLYKEGIDFVFPFFTCLQFVFYIGWFKVAQVLMRPFGIKEDDIELTYLLNRHIQTVFATLEHSVYQRPPHEKDEFFGKSLVEIGYTKLASKFLERPPKLHAAVSIIIPEDEEIIGFEEHALNRQRMSKKVHNLRTF